MGRAITERMDEMVEARAAEMTLNEATDIDEVASNETTPVAEESGDDSEDSEDEWNWSESVLVGVMEKNGITDRDAFVEFAKSYDMDGNRYLKGSELGAAAVDYVAKDTPAEAAVEPAAETVVETTSGSEPEVTWRTSGDTSDQ
jgi:hypothetical protein